VHGAGKQSSSHGPEQLVDVPHLSLKELGGGLKVQDGSVRLQLDHMERELIRPTNPVALDFTFGFGTGRRATKETIRNRANATVLGVDDHVFGLDPKA
jgi:hypothetical protein